MFKTTLSRVRLQIVYLVLLLVLEWVLLVALLVLFWINIKDKGFYDGFISSLALIVIFPTVIIFVMKLLKPVLFLFREMKWFELFFQDKEVVFAFKGKIFKIAKADIRFVLSERSRYIVGWNCDNCQNNIQTFEIRKSCFEKSVLEIMQKKFGSFIEVETEVEAIRKTKMKFGLNDIFRKNKLEYQLLTNTLSCA